MGEPNQVNWMGIRPTDPAEDIPITLDGESVDIKIPSGVTSISNYNYTDNNTVVIKTVGGATTLYIQSVWISGFNKGVDAGTIAIWIRDGSDVYVRHLLIMYLDIEQNGNLSIPIVPPLVVPSNYDVMLQSSLADCRGYGGIAGYEV